MSTKDTPAKRFLNQRGNLSRTGVLDLSKMTIEKFDIGSIPSLVTLKLNQTNLVDFSDLPPQMCLKEIIAYNSPIQSLKGLSKQKKLASINFGNTPISDTPNFRIAAIISVGPKLSVINSQPVTKAERKLANSYPPCVKKLLDAGWILQVPVPSPEDLVQIGAKYGITITHEEAYSNNYQPEELSAMVTHRTSTNMYETKEITRSPPSFAEQVADILYPIGFPIRSGARMNDDILSAVDSILSLVKGLESCDQPEQETEESCNEA